MNGEGEHSGIKGRLGVRTLTPPPGKRGPPSKPPSDSPPETDPPRTRGALKQLGLKQKKNKKTDARRFKADGGWTKENALVALNIRQTSQSAVGIVFQHCKEVALETTPQSRAAGIRRSCQSSGRWRRTNIRDG